MTIQFRASSSTTAGSSPRTVTKPTGVAEGDLLLLHVGTNSDVTPSAVPNGFTLVTGAQITGAQGIHVYAKVAGGSEPADYAVSFPSGGACVGMSAFYSDAAAEIAVELGDKLTNASGNRIWPDVVTEVINTMLAMFATLGSSTSSTPPVGSDERYDVGTLPRIYLMTEPVGGIGNTGTRTATGTATTSKTLTILVSEVQEPNPPAAPSDLTVVVL